MDTTNLRDASFLNFTVETVTNRTRHVHEFVVVLKAVNYGVISPVLITFGLCGNALHLITLRSPELRTVPFLYIGAVAAFDLACLILIACSLDRFKRWHAVYSYPVTFYQAHFELPLINIALTSGVYTALFLTVERLYILYRPLRAVGRSSAVVDVDREKTKAKLYIFACVACSTVLHLPQCFERTPNKAAKSSGYTIRDNADFDQRLLKAYRLIRELICRALPVLLLVVLNALIARTMKSVNARRARLRNEHDIRSSSRHFLATFSENRLTTMMVVISVVYAAGNLPQAVSMCLNSELKSNDVSFQIFRAAANTTEILHHCINFYVFCLTSRDYLRCFLRLCFNVKASLVGVFCRETRRKRASSADTSSAKFREYSIVSLPAPDEDLVFL